eukprot:1004789-Rhodomonas_salina.1
MLRASCRGDVGSSTSHDAADEVREKSATRASSPAPMAAHSISSFHAVFSVDTACSTWGLHAVVFRRLVDRTDEKDKEKCLQCIFVEV